MGQALQNARALAGNAAIERTTDAGSVSVGHSAVTRHGQLTDTRRNPVGARAARGRPALLAPSRVAAFQAQSSQNTQAGRTFPRTFGSTLGINGGPAGDSPASHEHTRVNRPGSITSAKLSPTRSAQALDSSAGERPAHRNPVIHKKESLSNFRAAPFQKELKLNTSGGIHQREAERISEQGLRISDSEAHRTCDCGRTCAECKSGHSGPERERLQPKLRDAGHLGTTAVPHHVDPALRSPGECLDPATVNFIEPRFGHNFAADPEVNARSGPRRPSTIPSTGGWSTSSPGVSDVDVVPSAPEPVRWLARYGIGRSLPSRVQQTMSDRFGFDFSQVKIHDDERAAAATHSVDAMAYTLGKDIAFAPGTFQPSTPAGLFLIAHELSHVVQQDGVPVSSQTIAIGEKTSAMEREANRVALAVMNGQSAAPQRGSLRSPFAQLQGYFLSEEPAGGCGLCYGIPANAGKAAHALIQTEFELLYPLGLVELPLVDTNDENGRLDLAVAVPNGFEIGEIKPGNEQGYADGITQIARYAAMISRMFPGRTVRPLTKLLPPVIFPTLSRDCPVQMLFVNPPVGGVYGYFCRPSFAELRRKGCGCPIPRRVQEEEKKQKKEKEKKVEQRKESLPENAPSIGTQILEFVERVIAGGVNVEQAVRDFLVAHPEILKNVVVVVAGIVAGDILIDILSGGTAIAKDPAVLSVLAAMVRVARLLQAGAAI